MLNSEVIKKFNLKSFRCPKLNRVENWGIKEWTSVKVQRCVESEKVKCIDNIEIEEQLGRINIELLFINANFDF
jgi:hypothetical protein